MKIELIDDIRGNLPETDDHPYRTGAWRPNTREYDAYDLEIEGELPEDLSGIYLRNTENPLHDAIGRYHPFDGDGMLHSMWFESGRTEYRNRYIRTDGFDAELKAGRALWAGLMERPERSERDGWGARTRLKDSSSTDVVVHRGRAATSSARATYFLFAATAPEPGYHSTHQTQNHQSALTTHCRLPIV